MIDIIDYNNDSSQFEKFVNASPKSRKKRKMFYIDNIVITFEW